MAATVDIRYVFVISGVLMLAPALWVMQCPIRPGTVMASDGK